MTDVTNTETATGFDALKGLSSSVENDAPVYVQKLDAQGRAYSTGKRKNAIARVWVKPGTGKITINGKDQEQYFARPVLRMMIAQPLTVSDRATQYDVICTVKGGGLSGQAGAVKHGIAQALGPDRFRLGRMHGAFCGQARLGLLADGLGLGGLDELVGALVGLLDDLVGLRTRGLELLVGGFLRLGQRTLAVVGGGEAFCDLLLALLDGLEQRRPDLGRDDPDQRGEGQGLG